MTSGPTSSTTPLSELATVEQNWTVASNTSVGGAPWAVFSAVCWFTYRDLYDATGNYDIVWYIAIALGVAAALINLPIKEVAIDLGFTTAKMFSRDFQLFHGVKPTDFQRKEHSHFQNAVI